MFGLMNNSISQIQAQAVADSLGLEMSINENHGNVLPFEDDGFLHIPAGDVSFCYEIGQDVRPYAFNKMARAVLAALNLPVNNEAFI